MFLVVGDKRGEEADSVLSPTFSPDGKRIAYEACQGGKRHVVIDGIKGPGYDWIDRPRFSPDGRKVAFGALLDLEFWWKVVNDSF